MGRSRAWTIYARSKASGRSAWRRCASTLRLENRLARKNRQALVRENLPVLRATRPRGPHLQIHRPVPNRFRNSLPRERIKIFRCVKTKNNQGKEPKKFQE